MAVRCACRSLLRAHLSCRPGTSFIHTSGVQQLFSSDQLGLDTFIRQQAVMRNKIGDLQGVFRERMDEYLKNEDNTVFTGDLKSMLYTASDENDLKTMSKMITRFRKQRQDIRFSDFVFGPIVMRLLHHLNRPDIALQLFTQDPEADGFYDQFATFSILMDLLFESGRYNDVIDVMTIVKERQVGGYKYPSNCFVLFAAACCKQNTNESHEMLLNELKDATKDDKKMSGRTYAYAVYLSIKQGDSTAAMEILDRREYPSGIIPVIHTNLKVLALTHLGRLEDAMFELQCLLNNDGPESRIHDVLQEVVGELQSAVDRKTETVLSHKMNELARSLEENHHLDPQSLEEYIFSPIIRKRQAQDGYKNRRRPGAMGHNRSNRINSRGLRFSE